MRPFTATKHLRLWLAAFAVFLIPCIAGIFRAFTNESIAGLVVVGIFAVFSLRKMYRIRVSALAVLVTLGIIEIGCLVSLGISCSQDPVMAISGWMAAAVNAIPVMLDLREIRRENIALLQEGRRRRASYFYTAACFLCIVGGITAFMTGEQFGGVWLVFMGTARGAMEFVS